MQNDAMHRLITTAKLLYANSVGCSIQHHENNGPHDLPGWLVDCAKDIEAAEAALAAAPAGAVKAQRQTLGEMPAYGSAKVTDLMMAVSEAIYGDRDFSVLDIDHDRLIGHQMVPQINFNSLNRIVSAFASPVAQATDGWLFARGDRVEKTKGSSWHGKVVGFYSTDLTSRGYVVESEREPGSCQLYPEAALAAAPTPKAEGGQ